MPIIITASEGILDQIQGAEDDGEIYTTERYPFRLLKIGQSFLIDPETDTYFGKTLGTMQVAAQKAEIKFNRKYVVIQREDGLLEVGRVPKTEANALFPIYQASPEAKTRMLSIYDEFGTGPDNGGRPWNSLGLGQCFIVKADESAGRSIRTSVAIQNRSGVKKYTVVHHKHAEIFEVARIL